MYGNIVVTCCCCKNKVDLGPNPQKIPSVLKDWVTIERKAFCEGCVASFTKEDFEWLTQTPRPLGLAEIALLIPGGVEPL